MRINIRRLITGLLVTLVLPLALAVLVDYSLGWAPFTTIGASLFFIPLSTVIVTRATLSELDKVIQQVAPLALELEIEADGISEPNRVTINQGAINQVSIDQKYIPLQ